MRPHNFLYHGLKYRFQKSEESEMDEGGTPDRDDVDGVGT